MRPHGESPDAPGGDARGPRALARSAAAPAVLCSLLWFVLTEGDAGSWLIGGPAVLACAAAAAVLRPGARRRIHLGAALAFLPFFAWRSLAGGLDVARRALGWKLALAPELLSYRLRLPEEGPARLVFVNVVSLLPGTLAADLDGSVVRVHTLGRTDDVPGLRQLEAHVAALFGCRLAEEER